MWYNSVQGLFFPFVSGTDFPLRERMYYIMKSFRERLSELKKEDSLLRPLSDAEMKKLRCVLLGIYDDVAKVCQKYGLTVMLVGGSALGAVRHGGFIPWDDDLDIAMPRHDYEIFRHVFTKELGKKYKLCDPSCEKNAISRFPKILVKDTVCVDVWDNPKSPNNKIVLDLFIIENIPDSYPVRLARGIVATALMFITGRVQTYQTDSPLLRKYMCRTEEGKRAYRKSMFIGSLFSFMSVGKWYSLTDRACRYGKKSSLAGIPTGRKHYFGETQERSTFLPPSKGVFEGREVLLPRDTDKYLKALYGDYMQIPPPEKREQHYIYKIKFNN